MPDILSWFYAHFIELLGTITGLLYIYYSVRQNILLWIFGIANALLLMWVYFYSGIYAYMGLQLYYLFISIYGWIHWAGGRNEAGHGKGLPVTRLNLNHAIWLLVITLVLIFTIEQGLKNFTDSTIPWLDSFVTAFSITATWMLARKILEHWLIWIIVDLVSCGIYIFKHLYLMTFLFLVYTILAIYGYYSWKKSLITAES